MRYILTALAIVTFLAAPASAQDKLLAQSKAALAKIDGEIKLPGLKEPVEVLRDRWGVPHIYAKNQDDLFFAQGFVAAQDRLFQIDLWRRLAVGELAEVLGASALDADTFARRMRYRGDMDAEWKSYSPDTKQIATAFTNGINACIKSLNGRWPIEFQILDYGPRQWQPEDILGRMSGIIMSRNFNDEIVRAHLIDKLGLEKVRLLMPTDPQRDFAPALDLKGIDKRVLAGYESATKTLSFKPSKSESNNWVVSGALSASGKPMLASDPHRAIALPALRYLVHLNAPGWNVIGAGEPGLPGVALGHNERIAWGITIVGTDQADFFVEETKPGDPTMYKVGDYWRPMEIVKEQIASAIRDDGTGTLKTISLKYMVEMRYTRHGPVLYQDEKTNRAYALKWAGHEPGGAAYLGNLAVARAQNQAEFLKALAAYKIPSLNFAYADVDGNIGWVANALTPIRAKHDGLLPVPGNGGYEWTGYRAVKDLPQSFNPKAGWLATANHNIIPPGYKHEIGYEFAPPYRFLRVKHNLEAKSKFTLEDFQRIQHDDVSIPGQRLVQLLKKSGLELEKKDDPYIAMMLKWDGSLARDSQAGVIFAHWIPILQEAVYTPLVGKELAKEVAAKSGLPTMLNALEKADTRWFGARPVGTSNEILLDSLRAAIAQVKKRWPDPDQMRWGSVHTVSFRHALAASHPELAKSLNIGPFERTGDANTPNNTRYDDKFQQIHGATYRHVFDLADWDKGMATSAPGQSGQFGSPHYADLAPLWAKGEYFPLAYSRKKVEEVTQNKLTLLPGN